MSIALSDGGTNNLGEEEEGHRTLQLGEGGPHLLHHSEETP